MDELLNDPQATKEFFLELKEGLDENIMVLEKYEEMTGVSTDTIEHLRNAYESLDMFVQDLESAGTSQQEQTQPESM